MFLKIGVLKNLAGQESTCVGVFFKKNLLAECTAPSLKKYFCEVFSCEVSEIPKNTFFTEHPSLTATAPPLLLLYFLKKK